ncbi:MAG: peptide-methionine (S)-S-oxide reductase MsrA [Candidatus Berkelbacteria bacterium]
MIKSAVFASGCFWGTQHYFGKTEGVIATTVGYIGGNLANPTYEQVSTGTTDHVEAVKVEYDSTKTNYEKLAKMFFETHDPTQVGGQGPDIGSQYQSKIFYGDEDEHKIATSLIQILEDQGLEIATKVEPLSTFYPAEEYHQDYYSKNGQSPYCHIYRKLF